MCTLHARDSISVSDCRHVIKFIKKNWRNKKWSWWSDKSKPTTEFQWWIVRHKWMIGVDRNRNDINDQKTNDWNCMINRIIFECRNQSINRLPTNIKIHQRIPNSCHWNVSQIQHSNKRASFTSCQACKTIQNVRHLSEFFICGSRKTKAEEVQTLQFSILASFLLSDSADRARGGLSFALFVGEACALWLYPFEGLWLGLMLPSGSRFGDRLPPTIYSPKQTQKNFEKAQIEGTKAEYNFRWIGCQIPASLP